MVSQVIRHQIELTDEEKYLVKEIKRLQTSVFRTLADDTINELRLLVIGTQAHLMAMIKFEELDAIMITAKFCLTAGSSFNHKAYSKNKETKTYDKNAEYHVNLHNLKSAVVWYISSIDYLLQIIYFGFEFNTPFHTQSAYWEELRKCVWNEKSEFYKDFCSLAKQNIHAKQLKERLEKLRQNPSVKRIRELANAIKHHGGFELEVTKREYLSVSVYDPDTGDNLCWKQIMEQHSIQYVDLVQNLISVHNEVVSFEKYLFNELGFSQIPSIIKNGESRKIRQSFSNLENKTTRKDTTPVQGK